MTDATLKDLILKALNDKKNNEPKNPAFSELVKRFQNYIFGYTYAMTKDSNLSQDISQETFISAFNHLEQLKQPEAFPGWIKQIAGRECLKTIKRLKQLPSPLENTDAIISENMQPFDPAEKLEFSSKMDQILNKLPETLRIPLTLYYIGNYSVQEIADFLKINNQTVKKRLQRARAGFRNEITDDLKEYLEEIRPSRDRKLEENINLYISLQSTGKKAQFDMLEQMLTDGLSIDSKNLDFDIGQILDTAAKDVQTAMLEQLLADGYDLESKDASGKTIQDWALEHKHTEMLNYLRKRKKRN